MLSMKMINVREGVMGIDAPSFSLIIRPVEARDASDINVMRRLPELTENLLALPSETIVQNEDFIARQALKMITYFALKSTKSR